MAGRVPRLPPLCAVLFDLDGTVLDPNGSIRATIDHVLAAAGLEPIAPEEVLVGMPLRDILALRAAEPARVEALVAHYRRHFGDTTWRLVRWIPGVRGVVEGLRAQGTRTAVVTTKGEGEADRLLRDLGVRGLFDTVVGDDDERPVKPDPAPVLEACRRLGVAPWEAAMVGDTRFDVEAGRAAGCRTVAVLWGHGTPEVGAQADAMAADAASLARLLAAWRTRGG